MLKDRFFKHWPTILLGTVVGLVMVAIVFSYQVNETQTAVVTTLGKIDDESPGPGLHFRWPYPIQNIYLFDHRLRSFGGNGGHIEETTTADGQNVLIGIFVDYRIDDAVKFFRTMEKDANAEKELNVWMRGAKNAIIGRYRFNQLINVDKTKIALGQIQQEMCNEIQSKATNYGMKIEAVGIKALNVPGTISTNVFNRMNQERQAVAERYLAEGKRIADSIRVETDTKKQEMLADAEAKAKEIRAEGDAEAARYYEVFKQSPELAIFLRKLESLRKVMKSRTTLVLDTNAVPFDLLQTGADDLNKVK